MSELAAKQTFAAMDLDHNYVVRADEFLPVSLFFHHATQGLHGAEHKVDFQDKADADEGDGTASKEAQKAKQAAASIEEELHNSPHAVCFDEHLTVPNQGELLFPTEDLWKAAKGAAPRWRGALVRGTDGEPVEKTPEDCLGLDLYGFLRLVEILRFTDRVNLELDGDGQDGDFLKLPTATDFVHHYPGLVWMMDVGISLQTRKAWVQPEFTKSKDSESFKKRAELEDIFGKDGMELDWVATPDWWRITAQDALLRGPTAAAQLLPLLYATPLWPSDDMRDTEPSALCAPSPYVVLRALGIWLELGQLDYDYQGVLRHEVFGRSALARQHGGPFDWETLAGGNWARVDLIGQEDGVQGRDADVALGHFSQYAPLSAMVAATSWMSRMSDATRYDLEALERTNGRLCAEKQLDFQRLKSAFWTGDVNHDGTLEPVETLVYAAWTALTAAFVLSADPEQFAVSRYQPEKKEGEEGYNAEQADLNAKRLEKLADVVSQLSIDPEHAWYSCADGTSEGLCKRQGLAWDQAVRSVGSIDSEGQGLGASRHDTFAATDLDKDGKVRFVEFAVRVFARHRSVRAHVSRRLQLREGGTKNALRHVELLSLGDGPSATSPTPDVRGPQKAKRSQKAKAGVEELPDRLVPLDEFVNPSRGAESVLHSRALDVQALFAIFGQDVAFVYGDADAGQQTTEVFREKDVMTVVSADRFLDLHEFYLCSEAPEKRRKNVLDRVVKYDTLPQLGFVDWMARSFAGAKVEWERQGSQAQKPADQMAFWEPSQQDVTLKRVTMDAVLTRWPAQSPSGESDAGLSWAEFARFFPAKVCAKDWLTADPKAEEATAAQPGTQEAQDLFFSAKHAKVDFNGEGKTCDDVYREYMDKVKAVFTTGPRSVVQATKCVAFWMRGAGWPPQEPRKVQPGQCQLPGSKFCHAKAADNGACECLLEALEAADPLPVSALEVSGGGLAQGLDLPRLEVLGHVGQRVAADGSVSAEARRVFE